MREGGKEVPGCTRVLWVGRDMASPEGEMWGMRVPPQPPTCIRIAACLLVRSSATTTRNSASGVGASGMSHASVGSAVMLRPAAPRRSGARRRSAQPEADAAPGWTARGAAGLQEVGLAVIEVAAARAVVWTTCRRSRTPCSHARASNGSGLHRPGVSASKGRGQGKWDKQDVGGWASRERDGLFVGYAAEGTEAKCGGGWLSSRAPHRRCDVFA
eukprot:scaffold10237_cov79-Isochrysis_galbana.AAC.3